MRPAVHELLSTAFSAGASDVLLIEGERPRVRQDGELVTAHGGALNRDDLEAVWSLAGFDPAGGLDLDGSFNLDELGRLRANGYRTLGRLAVALRPIRREIPDFDELGLPGSLLSRWMEHRSGLILVTGPTGSGKSTTIAACLQWLNRHHRRHVVTIEDPIEFLFSNEQSYFSQREVNHDTGGFQQGLRSALRQSPDVIFVGEIRDAESAGTALRAAETGHLVVSTLHSSGAIKSLDRIRRLIDSSNEMNTGTLLGQQLVGILSQRLLPGLDGGMHAMLEYFENAGATRRWITDAQMPELQDHLDKGDGETAVSSLRYLVAAARQSVIDPGVARAACTRPQDFDRAMRGIS